MIWRNLQGPTGKKKASDQLLGLKSGSKNETKNKTSKSEVWDRFWTGFGSHFGTFSVPKNGKKTRRKKGWKREHFGLLLGTRNGQKHQQNVIGKTIKKNMKKRSRGYTQVHASNRPVVPLKEQSQDWQTADLTYLRDTPLVPCGHGGGFKMELFQNFCREYHSSIWLE